MFTGLIRELGIVKTRGAKTLEVLAGFPAPLGASVAVNGACLTVTKAAKGALSFDVSAETWRRTALGALKQGDPVNLEPSLKLGDELGGHLVSGHVDSTGKILDQELQPGGFVRMRFSLPKELMGLVAVKGSIAVDGISLTVTGLGRGWFETVLVPHTLKLTTLGTKGPGALVNLEADMLARYVAAALSGRRRP